MWEIPRHGKARARSRRRRQRLGLHVGFWAPAVSARLRMVALNDTISYYCVHEKVSLGRISASKLQIYCNYKESYHSEWRKTVIFPYLKISQSGSYGTWAPWNVRCYSKKSFCGHVNLESTKLTEITPVMCFFLPAGHLNENLQGVYMHWLSKTVCFPNSFNSGTLYLEESLWNLCSVELTLGNTGILLLL